MSQFAFNTLDLPDELLGNLESLGYTAMTPVQALSLPAIIAGSDVIAEGKTGSGKTAAFGLGILCRLEPKRFCTQALVLCPTRELADQVADEIRRLARAIPNIKVATLCGGTPLGPQVGSLERGVHIVVGTPGRVEDHLQRNTLELKGVRTFVLDEADRMLEMGFQESVDNIIERVPADRQTLLLSATYPDEIQSIARRIMDIPVMVKLDEAHDDCSIHQRFFKVDDHAARQSALRLLLLQHQPESTLIFCNTRVDVRDVVQFLKDHGFSALALHGELDQRDRDQTLIRFSNKSACVLVATDVAARGLDIDSLDVVVNYQLARDAETHVHRVGRTGRAGESGEAWSFHDAKDDYRMAVLKDTLGRNLVDESLPADRVLRALPLQPVMVTLQIDGGKKQKLRPGDIVGALTGSGGINGAQIGRIKVFATKAYVAVGRKSLKMAMKKLTQGKMKGRSFRVRVI
ncbi:ATP-dependent RNA helicase DbpA [Chromatiales bacterium (ex Bugula neritina AB1)]|nr:ATP-dependent RNA helicase DbpA [Chromatiales bacterium (ex Bugula neritina AB1)]